MKDNMDIDVLRFFLVLYEYKHLTLAAQQCDLSKSAASRYLSRLRDHFHDELFRKCANGMIATPRAQRLYIEVQKMMRMYESLCKEEIFCPTKIRKVFRIAGVDNALIAYLSEATKAMLAIARKMTVQFVPMVSNIAQSLRSGELDFAVYPIPIVGEDIHSVQLARDHYVVVVDKRHPLVQKKRESGITIQDLNNYRKVRITTEQQCDHESRWIKSIDRVPHEANDVAIYTPYFYTATQLVCRTSYWTVVPEQLALRQLERINNFAILGRLPRVKALLPSLYWHDCTHTDPAYQWVRSMIIGTTKKMCDASQIQEISWK